MPKKETGTKKTLSKAQNEEPNLPVVDDEALAALDSLLGDSAAPPAKGGKGKKGQTKAEEDALPPMDFGDEPDTSEIEGMTLDAGAAGVSARIDSLVEVLSDYHNSTSNRLESLQTTIKSIFDLVQVRLDEMQAAVETLTRALQSADAEGEEEEEEEEDDKVDINDPVAVARAIGWDSPGKVGKILEYARGFKGPVAVPNFVKWLKNSGMPDKSVVLFGKLFRFDAGDNVTAATFK